MSRSIRAISAGLASLLLAPAVPADIYKWTDANGVLHFTANLDEVPPGQREAAAAGSSGRGSLQRFESEAPAAPAPTPSPSRAATTDGSAKPAPESFGGRTEQQWGAAFRQSRDAISRLDAAAERCKDDRFRWSEGAGRRKWEEETAEAQACARVKNELAIHRNTLERLEEQAHRAGVPPGWVPD